MSHTKLSLKRFMYCKQMAKASNSHQTKCNEYSFLLHNSRKKNLRDTIGWTLILHLEFSMCCVIA